MKATETQRRAIRDATLAFMTGDTERARWDALWRASDLGLLDVRALYSAGLNDSHIDTVLRRVQSEAAALRRA